MKPVPASVRHLVSSPDDEVFLDGKEEDIENDVTMDGGKKIVRRKRDIQDEDKFHKHIIFRRSPGRTAEDELSDYGELSASIPYRNY